MSQHPQPREDVMEDVCEACRRKTGRLEVVPCEEYTDRQTGEQWTLCLSHAKEWRAADRKEAEEDLAYYGEDAE